MLGPKIWGWVTLAASSVQCLAIQAPLDLGNGFSLTVDERVNHLSVNSQNGTLWETLPGRSFLSASAGLDQVVDSSGNFKITELDRNKCTSGRIHQVIQQQWPGSANKNAAVVQGLLSGCGNVTTEFSMAFYVPAEFPDRVAFRISINPGSAADPLTKLFLTYRSSPSEDSYGLGGQASFASLKNQSVPIFSREQGVGRGDQPTTRLEDEESFFSGGTQFTSYTAIPQYITSGARVFHLSEDSTAYANFDFQDPQAVTVRYAALKVEGYFMQASDMLHGISMLTEYTGRMPELPRWVDTGRSRSNQSSGQRFLTRSS